MSEEPNFDIETLRQLRIARLEAELYDLAGRLSHLHWPTTEAEVTDCRLVRHPRYSGTNYPENLLQSGYIVSFSYSVDGKPYTGVLGSPVEVEPGDHFALRYNPHHPDENNSPSSPNSRISIYSAILAVILGALIVALFIKEHFFIR